MHRVIHLLPSNGMGDAASAARSMEKVPQERLDFRLRWIYPKVRTAEERWRAHNPIALLVAARGILKERPDLLIVSLWPACAVGVLVRLFRPRTKLVVMIHDPVDEHWLDWLFARWAMAWSTAVWADSEASMRLRFDGRVREFTIIPFVTRHLKAPQIPSSGSTPAPSFVYWGPLAPKQNLARALRLFHLVWHARPDARFTIIGPGFRELVGLSAICESLQMEPAVHLKGSMKFRDICDQARRHSFFLHTGDHEELAVSVVEAMQLGLVPVVVPAGEIGKLCRAGENAVLIHSDEEAAEAVLSLLADPAQFTVLRDNAMRAWHGKPVYRDAVLAECRRLLDPRVD